MSLTVNTQVDEKHIFKVDGSELIYQDITAEDLMVLYRKFQNKADKKGEMTDKQTASFTIACMTTMVTGWKGVLDNKTGKKVPFKKEYVRGIKPSGIIRFFVDVLVPQMQEWGMTEGSELEESMGN